MKLSQHMGSQTESNFWKELPEVDVPKDTFTHLFSLQHMVSVTATHTTSPWKDILCESFACLSEICNQLLCM